MSRHILVDRPNGRSIQLRWSETQLIALLRSSFLPRAAQVEVIASAVGSCQLAVQEEGDAGFYRAGTHRVVRNEARYRRFNEGEFLGLEEQVAGSIGLGWGVGSAWLKRNLSPDCLLDRKSVV